MIQMFTKKRKKGFTLIELIVVVAILGILAALAIPRLTGVQENARKNTHDGNVKTLESAANIAVAEHGAPGGDGITWSEDEDGEEPYLKDNYISDWPTSPWSDGEPYEVEIDEDGAVTVSGGE